MHHRKLHGVAWVTPNLVLQDNGDILGQWNLKWKLLFRVSGFTEFYKFLLRGLCPLASTPCQRYRQGVSSFRTLAVS